MQLIDCKCHYFSPLIKPSICKIIDANTPVQFENIPIHDKTVIKIDSLAGKLELHLREDFFVKKTYFTLHILKKESEKMFISNSIQSTKK